MRTGASASSYALCGTQCISCWVLRMAWDGGSSSISSLLEPQARPPQVYLVTRAQALAAAVAGGDFNGAAVAKDARAEFAFVVANAVLARRPVEADMRVRAETVPLASSPPSSKTMSLRRTMRCWLSVSSCMRPRLMRGFSIA